jgi:hypothetical protein
VVVGFRESPLVEPTTDDWPARIPGVTNASNAVATMSRM